MKFDHFKNFVVLITGILRDSQERILLIERSDKNKTFKGFWQLPEGKIEFGEQPTETLSRELKEELGCRLITAQPLLASTSVINFQGTSYHLLRIVFDARWEGSPILSEEHDDFKWFKIDKAARLPCLVDGTKEILLSLKFIFEGYPERFATRKIKSKKRWRK